MPLPIKCVMCFGLTCLILGFLFLATFSSHLMPAAIYTAKFKHVACTVTSSDYYPEDSCCDLVTPTEEKPCENIYPCLRVIVAVIKDGDTVADNATLYDSYTTIYYQPKEGSVCFILTTRITKVPIITVIITVIATPYTVLTITTVPTQDTVLTITTIPTQDTVLTITTIPT